MKRNILMAVVAAALFAPLYPAAAAASARDHYSDDHRDRDSYRDRDLYRDREYHREHDGHGYRRGERAERFVVHYHLDGKRRVHAKSHDRAHRIEDLLRSVGADARVGPGCVVYYRMRGEGRTFRYSHEDAHRLARKLEGYGFHAEVRHR